MQIHALKHHIIHSISAAVKKRFPVMSRISRWNLSSLKPRFNIRRNFIVIG
ncbi:hypothetical protein Agau_L101266 [Agrobacterium tumefaciens F2]|nr:hypothetical protein Agau_L101266 [Agrobacterium tumefaciens F2]